MLSTWVSRKRFHSVPHKKLIGFLKQYEKKNTGWINNFLLIRRQRIVINDSRSEWRDVLSGIPQGFVLGPVLFVISMNSMPNTVKSNLYLLADNAKLLRENTSDKDLELLPEGLGKLKEWSQNSLLHFNEDKCVHMIISNGSSNRELSSYGVYDKQLETVGEEKDLGVIIDSKLSFDSHILAKVKKAISIIAVFKKNFRKMSIPVFLNVYKDR